MRLDLERTRIGRWPLAAVALASMLSLGALDASAWPRREELAMAPITLPPADPALAGPALDPSWRKHVFVVTDSVMLGAKDDFIRTMRDSGWEVTFTGRVSLFLHNGLRDYVLPQHDTGPVAVVALGYNSSWEKNRREYWAGIFDKSAEDMIAALKERGARKIVWVLLRELTPAMAAGARDMREYNSYAFYLPWVNERLRALKARHPEITLADWTTAANRSGLTEGMIHLSAQGGRLMAAVVKAAIGVDQPAPSAQPPVAVAAAPPVPETPRLAFAQEQPRVTAPRRPRYREVRVAEIRIGQLPPMEPQAQEPREEPAKPAPRSPREAMFALTRIGWADVVMLGDSHTERAPWAEITGCYYVANRGIGGDVSSNVLRRVDDVVRLKPLAVFLMIGINDLSRNVPIETIVGNVRQTIERLNEAGAKVYLTLTLPVSRGYVPRMNPRVAELDAAYIALARETNATVVDFRREVETDEGALRNNLTVDGLHLNPEGYRIWRDAITPLVQRHCKSSSVMSARALAAAPGRPIAPSATDLTTASVLPPPSAPAAPRSIAPQAPGIASTEPTEPAVARPARGEWMIQVGAYPDEEEAKERIRQAQSVGRTVLANLDGFTEKVVKSGRALFRARFAGFSRGSAESACSHFRTQAIDCVLVRK